MPGHTAGCMALLYRERFLFTGDHLWWDPHSKSLAAPTRLVWRKWTLIESIRKLLDYPFEWVLAGHGDRIRLPQAEMRAHLLSSRRAPQEGQCIYRRDGARPLFHWIDRNILSLGREMRLSYLPPLMVYVAYGISGLTGIVGTFFVKDYLGLSAAFLAALGFWAGIPWALKMPIGHTVDLVWRWKSWLVGLGAGLLTISLGIMALLIGEREAMTTILPAEVWYVLSVLLAPIGYVVQDVVADAMTVEAVPRVDDQGHPFDDQTRKLMHTTMQTLGRVAIVGGGILVALINVYVFSGTEGLPQDELVRLYKNIYLMAMVIPVVSVAGVGLAWRLKRQQMQRFVQEGFSPEQARQMVDVRDVETEPTQPNWWILGGSAAFVLFTLTVGLGGFPYREEIVFAGSMSIVLFLMSKLVRELEPDKRLTLVGTAAVIFALRAIPGPGPGSTWWMIDDLKFDQQFLSVLSLIGGILALVGMFVFRRFMAERSIMYVVGFLTVVGTILSLPIVGMFYGLHEWTENDRRSRRCTVHCLGRHGTGIAARADLHDSDVGLDREFGSRQSESHLLCRDGFLHQSCPFIQPARHQVSE